MKIKKDFRNELLKRREVEFVFESEKNPGFAVAREKIHEKFKISPENVVVKFVKNNFGAREFLVEAFLYDSVADKEAIEQKPKVKKAVAG